MEGTPIADKARPATAVLPTSTPQVTRPVRDILADCELGECEDTLRAIFSRACSSVVLGDGVEMSRDAFIKFMDQFGCKDEYCVELFRAFDLDNNGLLSRDEFGKGMAAMDPKTPHSGNAGFLRLEYVFRFYDRSNDGALDADKFLRMVRHIHMAKGVQVSSATIKAAAMDAAARMHAKSTARITLEEFKTNVQMLRFRGTSYLLRLPRSVLRAPGTLAFPGDTRTFTVGGGGAAAGAGSGLGAAASASSSSSSSSSSCTDRVIEAVGAATLAAGALAIPQAPSSDASESKHASPPHSPPPPPPPPPHGGEMPSAQGSDGRVTSGARGAAGSAIELPRATHSGLAMGLTHFTGTPPPASVLSLTVHDVDSGASQLLGRLAASASSLPFPAPSQPTLRMQYVEEAQHIINFLMNPEGLPSHCNWVQRKLHTGEVRSVLHIPEHKLERFADALEWLAVKVSEIFVEEPKLIEVKSPAFVLGDLHGNMEDLSWFASKLWALGPLHSAGQFVFLGDYVDRGPNGCAVVAYLFALKLASPRKFILLRGNHETRGMNCKYGFQAECHALFGPDRGERVFQTVSDCFDAMPLAALVDGNIFCCHGGIPRPGPHGYSSVLDDIRALPPRLVSVADGGTLSTAGVTLRQAQLAYDIMWADPASPEQEAVMESMRVSAGKEGKDASEDLLCLSREFAERHMVPREVAPRSLAFSNLAVDEFCHATGVTKILRGHTVMADGFGLHKNRRVLTVFSDSKDHGVNGRSGWVLVEERGPGSSKIHLHVGGQRRGVRR